MRDKKTKINDIKSLGENLKRRRQFKGFTQEQLATKVGLTKNIISKIETAKQEIEDIDIKYILSISRELDISIEELFLENPKKLIIEFVIKEKNIGALKKFIRSCEKLLK